MASAEAGKGLFKTSGGHKTKAGKGSGNKAKNGGAKMENLNEIQKMLESFEKENRFYWINALLKQGAICKAEAGWLCVELGILA